MKNIFGCFSPKGSPKGSPKRTTPDPTPGPGSASASTSTNRGTSEIEDDSATASPATLARINKLTEEMETLSLNLGPVPIQKFTFNQLQLATENFSPDKCVGHGGFGRVYRGNLAPQNQQVAIKRLDPKSDQGSQEFAAEVELLSNAKHENIIRLIGYCAENEHRMLVYEYIKMGSLEDHLLYDPNDDTHLGVLDWNTRVRIAYEIAKGLQYLHEMEPHKMIYRDLKCANILLEEGFTVKLSDFGCAKRAPTDENQIDARRVGTQGYLDPTYFTSGKSTFETDIYTFGVVLMELVTGRKSLNIKKELPEERSLVLWAKRVFSDMTTFAAIVDPLLEGKFDEFTLDGLVNMARHCLQGDLNSRPKMHHIVDVLRQLNQKVLDSES